MDNDQSCLPSVLVLDNDLVSHVMGEKKEKKKRDIYPSVLEQIQYITLQMWDQSSLNILILLVERPPLNHKIHPTA